MGQGGPGTARGSLGRIQRFALWRRRAIETPVQVDRRNE